MAKSAKRARRSASDADSITRQVCDLFFRKLLSPAKIVKALGERRTVISRAQVYHYLQRGEKAGVVRLVPQRDIALRDQIVDRFGNLDPDSVHVIEIPVGTASANVYIADAVATVIAEALTRLQRMNLGRPVGLGLGSGRLSLDVMRCLDRLLVAERPLSEKIRLISLTSAAPVEAPEYCPISYFNLLHREFVDKSIGLFAEPMMRAEDFAELDKPIRREEESRLANGFGGAAREGRLPATDDVSFQFGYRHAARHRGFVDIVVTGLGDPRHASDLYRNMIQNSGVPDVDGWLVKRGIVGNIQYRPFTRFGPYIEQRDEMRPTTLFDIPDFIRLANNPHKCVVLAVRPSERQESRARALWPLIRGAMSPIGQRTFSQLVIDTVSAQTLLKYDDWRVTNPGADDSEFERG